jgi:hypothetical protein
MLSHALYFIGRSESVGQLFKVGFSVILGFFSSRLR